MRIRKFFKTLPMKLYLLLAAALLFAFFSNDFGLVDIQKTAIILAAAIDKTETGFSVTAQIAVPKGSDRTTGGTSSVEIEAEGETVSDCISLIFAKTGWVPKLVFCDLILLGEEAAKGDSISLLNYFLRNDYMPDSCLLAVCEGRAGDVISSESAIDDASSLAIEKLFSEAAEKAGNVMTNTLKDFSIGYYGKSKSGYLPYIRMVEQTGEQNDSDPHGNVETSKQPQKVYSATETAIFSDGRMVGILPAGQTFAFSLLEGNVFSGTFGTEGEDGPVTLTVMRNDGGISLDLREEPVVSLSLKVTVRLCCRGVTAPVEDIAADAVPSAILDAAKETLQGYVEELWQTCMQTGCDLFCLKRSLFRTSRKAYETWKDAFAPPCTIQVEVVSMR